MSAKIIARIKGGLGNQLFAYAAARRLAIKTTSELVIDDVSGFVRDKRYQRAYALDHFTIPCRKAKPAERLEPFERWRRGISKWRSRHQSFEQRKYIEQIGNGFEERLMTLEPTGIVYLDGLWQDERHFSDIADVIRSDLTFNLSLTDYDRELFRRMNESESVALHVRWFDNPGLAIEGHNLSADYYDQAVKEMERRVPTGHYFLFSDNTAAAIEKIKIPRNRLTIIDHNIGDLAAVLDLWLMSQCKHFILANSTFGWWGAWFSAQPDGFLTMPDCLPALTRALVLPSLRN